MNTQTTEDDSIKRGEIPKDILEGIIAAKEKAIKDGNFEKAAELLVQQKTHPDYEESVKGPFQYQGGFPTNPTMRAKLVVTEVKKYPENLLPKVTGVFHVHISRKLRHVPVTCTRSGHTKLPPASKRK